MAAILSAKLEESAKNIYYSPKYYDSIYEYRQHQHGSVECLKKLYDFRHVMLPKDIAKLVPKSKLMSETEWRSIGVQQSQGWVHYMVHKPEPHILLFRRPITCQAAAKKAQQIFM